MINKLIKEFSTIFNPSF